MPFGLVQFYGIGACWPLAFFCFDKDDWSYFVLQQWNCFFVVPGVPPHNLHGNSSSATSVWISWDPIPSQLVNGVLLGYTILYKWVQSPVYANVSVSGNITRIVLDQLQVFSEYEFLVAGRTAVGTGNFSSTLILKTGEGGNTCLRTSFCAMIGCFCC